AAGGKLLVFAGDGFEDLVHADAERAHPVGLEVDFYLAHDAADQRGLADAADGFQPLANDAVSQGGELAQVARSGIQCQGNDGRVVRVEAADLGFLDFAPEAGAHKGYLVAHVLRGHRRVRGQVELRYHARAALERARTDGLDAADRVHGFLDLARDIRFHRLGGGARILCLYDDDGEADVRKLVDIEALVGKQPEHQQRRHHHGGKNGVVDADAGDPHG